MKALSLLWHNIKNKTQELLTSLRAKLIISYLIIIFISLLLFGVIVHVISSNAMIVQAKDYASLILNKYNEELDQTIDEIDRITKISLINQNILDVLSNPAYVSNSNNNEFIQNYIFQIMTLRTDIDKIYLTDLKGHNYTFGYNNYITTDYDIRNESWYKIFEKSPNLFMIVPPYYNSSIYNYSVLSVARKIKDPFSNKINGLIKIDIKVDFLNKMKNINSLGNSTLIVLDQFDVPIYNSNPNSNDLSLNNILKHITKNNGNFIANIAKNTYVVSYEKSNYTNWTLLLITPQKTFLNKISAISLDMVVTGIFCACLALIFSITISCSITKSVEALSYAMKNVEKGDFTTNIVLNTKDEIGYLAKSFNDMVQKVNILMKINSEIKAKQTEAQIKALESQINPHFIYNTLEAVRMKAITNKGEEASIIIEELGLLLRHNLSNNRKDFIPFNTELEYIKRYINLYNLRFKEKIDLFINIPDEFNNFDIPKFILQPIVENSVIHGLEPKKQDRRIELTAENLNDYIIIKVKDSGKELDSALIDELNEAFFKNKADFKSRIGMANVNNRLKLYYGDECGLGITSLKNEGTTVTVKLKTVPETIKLNISES